MDDNNKEKYRKIIEDLRRINLKAAELNTSLTNLKKYAASNVSVNGSVYKGATIDSSKEKLKDVYYVIRDRVIPSLKDKMNQG